MTAVEISRLAGVTRATVSNWRRRHPDFPQPSGGTEASPTYDRRQVEAWLQARGQLPDRSATDDLRTRLRGRSAAEIEALALLVAHLAGFATAERIRIANVGDDALLALHKDVPGMTPPPPGGDTVALWRSAVNVLAEEGTAAILAALDDRADDPPGVRGSHPTPAVVAELMADLATTGPARMDSVLDPACGGGTLLTATATRLGPEAHVYGQDSRVIAAALTHARVREALPGAHVDVRGADSLRDDAFPGLRVDVVVCNPPYGDREWGHEELALDPRWAFGVPPRAEPELAWVQHVLAHLDDGGQAAMLLPPATASRPSGRRIRTELLRQGAVRAVIALPSGLAVPYHIGLHLWILHRPPEPRVGEDVVLFADVSQQTSAASRARDEAPDESPIRQRVNEVWRAFSASPATFAAIPATARGVPAIDLLDDLVDLAPARHVRTALVVTPTIAARHLTDMVQRLAKDVAALAKASELDGWSPADGSGRTWRSASLADLVNGRAVTVHRGNRSGPAGDVPAELAGRRVLRARDLIDGAEAEGDPEEERLTGSVVIAAGDVLLAQTASPTGAAVRVADECDAGCLLGNGVHLLRPDPDRLDPWFLAGFAGASDNISQATTGTSTHHLVASRLRIPLLPLDEQRTYGRAFEMIHRLRRAARDAAGRADQAADLLTTGLTGGALLPPGGESP
ncbi:N-6 DNA methylase [Actinomadura rayongensis]|uniref:N-6 DNA methylase n=1 Tax=Actinomadura rayongensis TaxID=1429076 RepID=A0A6I4W6D7_9ACTN|nr:N-6 DNA methylase [Actinomadura rayongensis]